MHDIVTDYACGHNVEGQQENYERFTCPLPRTFAVRCACVVRSMVHARVGQIVSFFTSLACRVLLLSRVESSAMAATLIAVALYNAFLILPGALRTEMYRIIVFVRGCLFERRNN